MMVTSLKLNYRALKSRSKSILSSHNKLDRCKIDFKTEWTGLDGIMKEEWKQQYL